MPISITIRVDFGLQKDGVEEARDMLALASEVIAILDSVGLDVEADHARRTISNAFVLRPAEQEERIQAMRGQAVLFELDAG
jgi:hypothetical protein